MPDHAVITGLGIVAPPGIGTQAFWQGVSSGRSFLTPLVRFDASRFNSSVVGTVEGFDPTCYLDRRLVARTDRWTWFDLVCAQQALADADLDLQQRDTTRVGAVFAAGTGGNEFGQRQLHLCWQKGPHAVSAYQSIAWFYAASIGQVSIRHKLRGYGRNICAESAGGLIALAHAAKLVESGICDVVVVSGSEASIAPYAFACYQISQLLSPSTESYPYRPFDATRSGAILGEGGAAFCVESLEHAQKRGTHIYAEIAGSGQTFDGITKRELVSDGRGYARALQTALQTAQIRADEVDWMLCDALGTVDGDRSEVKALQMVFGPYLQYLPASAPKSMFGRLFNGSSTVDVAMALLAFENKTILPTVGYTSPDPDCPIDCVPNKPRPQHLRHILVGARGFGGFNAALLLREI